MRLPIFGTPVLLIGTERYGKLQTKGIIPF